MLSYMTQVANVKVQCVVRDIALDMNDHEQFAIVHEIAVMSQGFASDFGRYYSSERHLIETIGNAQRDAIEDLYGILRIRVEREQAKVSRETFANANYEHLRTAYGDLRSDLFNVIWSAFAARNSDTGEINAYHLDLIIRNLADRNDPTEAGIINKALTADITKELMSIDIVAARAILAISEYVQQCAPKSSK